MITLVTGYSKSGKTSLPRLFMRFIAGVRLYLSNKITEFKFPELLEIILFKNTIYLKNLKTIMKRSKII